MSGKTKRWVTTTAACALVATSLAQGISVNVNGHPVSFSGVGPQQINGRVMVPLRGVMEQLGAYVGYDAATRTVTATRGDIDLQLRLGQRLAKLNGREVTLDVPAMEYRGSTLVPLRFMGEALGADVRWDGAAQAVNISTDSADVGRPLPIEPGTPAGRVLEITSFTADREGYLRGGGQMTFTLEGTPGAKATLQIPGVTQEIEMTEVSPGRYQARVTAPTNALTVNKAAAIARLRIGSSERLIQAPGPVSVDTESPKILENSPAPNSRTSSTQPNITVSFDDGSGSGIATDRVRITLDGRDVTSDASVTNTFLAYRPPTALPPGKHEVVVTAEDRAGNPVSRTWAFNVGRRSGVIQSFTSTAGANPEPGDVVRFTLVGEAGGTATYSIGKRLVDLPMREVSPGRYEAEYTVRRNDDLGNEEIKATLRTREGETYTTDPRTDLAGSRQGVVRKPVITSPAIDAKLADQFLVTGTAPRGARVRLVVQYKASVLGVLGTTGTLSEQTVDVDEQGRWESQPIRLSGFATGRGTTYTITATTIGRNGKESEPVVINARR
jgi:hypothetical protein